MAYNDAIEQLKNALKSYSDEEDRIKELYAKAKGAINENYARDIAAAERERAEKRAEAEADAKRQIRNTDLTLAARGLAFSGEAAQTRLDSALGLNKRLAAIDAEHARAENELAKARLESETKADGEEAKRVSDAREGQNRIKSEIAQLEIKREAEQAKAAERERAAAPAAAADTEVSPAENGYRPPVTARVLAEQIINSVNSRGYVTKSWEMKKIADKLDNLVKGYEIDKDYLDDLIFTLRAYGYTEPKQETRSALQILADDAEAFYKSSYATTYAACQMAGFNEDYSTSHAKEKATAKLLEYVYDRVSDAREFRNVCTVLGISGAEANEYLEKQRVGGKEPAESSK